MRRIVQDGTGHRLLGSLCAPVRGVTFSASETSPTDAPGLIACLTTSGVQDTPDWSSQRYIPKARVSPDQLLRAGDILVSTANSVALVGKSCLVEAPPYACTFGAFVTVLRPNGVLHPKLLHWWLRSPAVRDALRRLASNTTNIANLKVSAMLDLAVPVPSPLHQLELIERLSATLTVASSALRAAAEAAEAAERLLPTVLSNAFHGVRPVSADEAPRETPASGWRWQLLTDMARLESGHTPSRRHPEWWTGAIPWIALPDIRALDGRIAFETSETVNDQGIANSSARVLPKHTVVMSRTASVGFVAIMGRPMATSQDFVNWVCGPELDPFFLAYALRASRGYIRGLASGAVHKTVYMPTLNSLRVCVPPIDEQRRIVGELDRRLREVERVSRGVEGRLHLISTLSAAILRAAFSEQESVELRRGAVASYLVERLHDQPTFGRVMLQKLLYLTEAHLGVDLGCRYERRAAGPHAPVALREVETMAEKKGWFGTRREEGRYVYTPGPNISERLAAAEALLGDGRAELDRLVAIFGHRRTEIAEVVATLFAAWNDFLIDGHAPTDDEIVTELHTNWHERKRTFSAERLLQALDWMRNKHIVPVGRGPRTEMVNA